MLARDLTQDELQAAAEEAEDDAAMAEYEAGRWISHEAVMTWVASWGTPDETPPPKVGD